LTINRSGQTFALMEAHDFSAHDVGRFAVERQTIWHKRTILGEPGPWTEDPALQRFHFCNVQRDLDRGTVYLATQLAAHAGAPRAERLLNTAMYRQLNRRDLWESGAAGWIAPTADGVLGACEALERHRQAGNSIGPTSWMPSTGTVSGCLREVGLGVVEHLGELDELCDSVTDGSLEPVQKYMKKNCRRLTGMVGFQVCLDLTYTYPNLSDDVWVWLYGGHEDTGSHWTARRLRPDMTTLECCRWLRDTQDAWLAPHGWGDVAWEGKPRLSLADVEHLLCEYRKWVRATLTRGAKRKYRGLGEGS